MFKKLYKRIKILHNLFIQEKVFINKKSYSQDEEDIQINKYCKNIKSGFYVDVGCFHPTRINNTYLLYKNNWMGINIDVSEYSIELFNYWRKKDINICIAVDNQNKTKKLYYPKNFSVLSTLDKNFAKKHFLDNINERLVKCDTLTNIINHTKYLKKRIDFLNIDIEGRDLDVLKSLDFTCYRPRLICIEDIKQYKKITNSDTYKFLTKKNYKHLWSGRFSHIYKSY